MPDAFAQFGTSTAKGVAGSYSVAWGKTPGVCRLAVGSGFAQIGQVANLTITFRGRSISLRGARAVDPSIPAGVSTVPIFNFSALDRRWKWKYAGRVYGSYNAPQTDTTLKRERNPRQIATLLLEALGEPQADVGALPTDPRPQITWDAAHPAEELERFAGAYGCAIAFDPIDDRFRLIAVGEGSTPDFTKPIISSTEALTTPARPSEIWEVTGPVLFQTALRLGEAVGRDVDGRWRPINQLSYTPAGGWESIDPWDFKQLTTEYVDPATGDTIYHRNLATATIWRNYRITGQLDGLISPRALRGQGVEPLTIKDIGPFLGSILDRDPSSGERLPMYVRGVYADERIGYENSKPNSRFPGSVSINAEERIATFSLPLFKYNANDQPIPADVALIAAYNCTKDGVKIRYEQHYPLNQGAGQPAGPLADVHDEMVPEFVEAGTSPQGAARDNLARVLLQAGYYAQALERQFREAPAANITYGGLHTFRLDGRLRSITWSWSTHDTPTTQVTWNCERSSATIPWEQRTASRLFNTSDYQLRQVAAMRELDASRKAARVAE